MKELIVSAKVENMEKVQAFVRAELAHTLPKTQNQTAIAVDEIFSNIVNYAYPANAEDFKVTVRIDTKENIILEFEDIGLPFNPLVQQEPDISLDADERAVGGLGIFLVKNLMDEVTYRREGNRNILTLRKILTQ